MAATGVGFAIVTAFWPLLVIAFVGTMNPTSGDASVFLPLEQTVLTQTIEPRRRTALFARYSVIGSLAGAVGVLAASAPDIAAAWVGCDRADRDAGDVRGVCGCSASCPCCCIGLCHRRSRRRRRHRKRPRSKSRRLVYGLAALFGMDSFGTGFLVQSLLALWLYQTFQVSVSTAAAILFWSGVCSAVSYLVAVPIAERIGLINTMVFTHLPSNVLLMLIPFAPESPTAIGLLLARSALSQMDVPTRASYVMAVVSAGGTAGRGEHHGSAEDLCVGGGFDDLGLSADGVGVRLAAADRRRGEGGLRHSAADPVPKGAAA